MENGKDIFLALLGFGLFIFLFLFGLGSIFGLIEHGFCLYNCGI